MSSSVHVGASNGYVEPGPGTPPTCGRCLRLDCGMVQRYELCATQNFVSIAESGRPVVGASNGS